MRQPKLVNVTVFPRGPFATEKAIKARQAFSDVLAGIPDLSIAVGVKLQKGGGVHELFKTLLDDPAINRFAPPYTTVSALLAVGQRGNRFSRAICRGASGRSRHCPRSPSFIQRGLRATR